MPEKARGETLLEKIMSKTAPFLMLASSQSLQQVLRKIQVFPVNVPFERPEMPHTTSLIENRK